MLKKFCIIFFISLLIISSCSKRKRPILIKKIDLIKIQTKTEYRNFKLAFDIDKLIASKQHLGILKKYENKIKREKDDNEKYYYMFQVAYILFKTKREQEKAAQYLKFLIIQDYFFKDYCLFFLGTLYPKTNVVYLKTISDLYPNSALFDKANFEIGTHYYKTRKFKEAKAFLLKINKNPNLTISEIYNLYNMLFEVSGKSYHNTLCKQILKNRVVDNQKFQQHCHYDNILKSKHKEGDVYSIALSFQKNKKYRKAIEYYEKELARANNDKYKNKVLKQIAYCYKRLNNKKEQFEVFKELQEKCPDAQGLERFAVLLIKMGEDQEALRALFSAYNDHYSKKYAPEVLMMIGNVFLTNTNFNAAKFFYELLIKRYPKAKYFSLACFKSALISFAQERYEEAETSINRITKKSNLYLRSLYWKARLLALMDKKDIAEDLFKRVYKDDSYGYYGLLSLEKLKDKDELTDISDFKGRYTVQISSLTKDEISHLKKAEILINLGMKNFAKQELSFLRFNKVKNQKFWYYLAVLSYITNDYFKAVRRLASIYTGRLPKSYLKIKWPLAFYSLIKKYAKEFHVDPILVLSLARQESLFDPDALSFADAYGLLQMLPMVGAKVAKQLNYNNFVKEDLFDAERNIKFSVYHIRELLNLFKQNPLLMIPSYNAGVNMTRKWSDKIKVKDLELFIEFIPYQETRTYIKRILENYINYKRIYFGYKGGLEIQLINKEFQKYKSTPGPRSPDSPPGPKSPKSP